MPSPRSEKKRWAVSDVRFVEVEIASESDRQMRVEFDCGVRVVIAERSQVPLAAAVIDALRGRSDGEVAR